MVLLHCSNEILLPASSMLSIPFFYLLEKYMFSIQDQLSTATRNNINAQLAMVTSLSSKTFEGFEKLWTLNVAAAKASVEESSVIIRQMLKANDAREIVSLSLAQAQPNVEKAIAYSRHVAHIASGTHTEFIKAANEQFDEARRNVTQLVDDMAKNAPAGSRVAVDVVRSAIDAASASYEQVTRNAKQAAAVVGGTLDTVTTRTTTEVPVIVTSA
jgi:phasin family protein